MTSPPTTLDPTIAARLKRDSAGLVAAIIQQVDTREVLMLGWMDDEALRRTLTEGRVTFFSRSRQEYWRKGILRVISRWSSQWRLTVMVMPSLSKLIRWEVPATPGKGPVSSQEETWVLWWGRTRYLEH